MYISQIYKLSPVIVPARVKTTTESLVLINQSVINGSGYGGKIHIVHADVCKKIELLGSDPGTWLRN